MQRAYLTALYELARRDPNIISIIGDSGTGYDQLFKRDLPAQFFDFGISEEHMVAAAAGMADCGKIPFVYTAGAFLAYRSYEFIRDDVCLQNSNVKIVGMGSGLSWSMLGPTHHTTEDLAVLRSMPNLTVLSPASPAELYHAVSAAYEIKGPVYLRIGMGGEPEIYELECAFKLGKNVTLREGADTVVFATGTIVPEVLSAANILEAAGIRAKVVNVHSIKPFDTQGFLDALQGVKLCFSVEEHNIIGGLGGLISEVIAEYGVATRLCRIGIPDTFAHGYGPLPAVRKANALDGESLALRIGDALKNIG